ncbi:MAG: hypothetical protein U0795_21230 [Pirellulales bacterium]
MEINDITGQIVDAAIRVHSTGVTVGLLINFNVVRLKDGLKRIVQGYVDPLRVG